MTTGRDELLKAAGRAAERADEVKRFLTEAGLKFDAAETNVKEAVPPREEREEGKGGLIHTRRVARICGFAQGWGAASAWPDPPTVTAEHIMLAMLVDGDGVGAQAIRKEGVNVENVIIHIGNRLSPA